MDDKGGNIYAAGADSGAAVITAPLTSAPALIRSGALELSNVDLSKEFVNLIIASTGFSAASRVITTSNQLIQELAELEPVNGTAQKSAPWAAADD